MKILAANIIFQLPDDFEGTISEAFELLSRHLEHSQITVTKPIAEKCDLEMKSIANGAAQAFQKGNRFFGATSISNGSFDTGWETIQPVGIPTLQT